MIRVVKPEQAPRILRERGRRTTETNQQAFENGERAFEFDSSLYGAKSVKNDLIAASRRSAPFANPRSGT